MGHRESLYGLGMESERRKCVPGGSCEDRRDSFEILHSSMSAVQEDKTRRLRAKLWWLKATKEVSGRSRTIALYFWG